MSTGGVRQQRVSSGPPVVAALWRAIDVLRPIALGWAAYGASVRSGSMTRPWLAWAVLGTLAAWTVVLLLRRSRTSAWTCIASCSAAWPSRDRSEQ